MLKTKLAIVSIALTLLSSTLMGCSKEQTIESGIIRASYSEGPVNPHYQSLLKAGEYFEKATDGRFKFQIYPNGVLGDQRASIELLRNGAIQLCIVSAPLIENYNPDFKIISIPYTFTSLDHQKKVLTSDDIKPLWESTRDHNFEVVAAFTAGSRNMYAKKPIRTPDDMKNMKVRVMESPLMLNTIACMGGQGTPMNSGEVYTALQQGVIDAAENNEVTYENTRHFEVAKYFSRTKHIMTPDLVIGQSEFLDRLSAEDRAKFEQAMKDAINYEFGLWENGVERAVELTTKAGTTYVDVDITPFKQACQGLREKELANGSPLVQKLKNVIETMAD